MRIGTRTGRERFQSDGIHPGTAEEEHKQAGEDGFADAGISAGDNCDPGAYCQFMLST